MMGRYPKDVTSLCTNFLLHKFWLFGMRRVVVQHTGHPIETVVVFKTLLFLRNVYPCTMGVHIINLDHTQGIHHLVAIFDLFLSHFMSVTPHLPGSGSSKSDHRNTLTCPSCESITPSYTKQLNLCVCGIGWDVINLNEEILHGCQIKKIGHSALTVVCLCMSHDFVPVQDMSSWNGIMHGRSCLG